MCSSLRGHKEPDTTEQQRISDAVRISDYVWYYLKKNTKTTKEPQKNKSIRVVKFVIK